MVDIAELRRLLAETSPPHLDTIFGSRVAWGPHIVGRMDADDLTEAQAELVVAAVNNLRALLDEIETAREASHALSLAGFSGTLLEQVGAVLAAYSKLQPRRCEECGWVPCEE